ncbi:MAG: hypothetical protein K0R66_500 [Gammaproteobacteria bacterium]|nr:hypothetical protein [Gammaproteobacteria bacterium]
MFGITPLHAAAFLNDHAEVARLLEASANPNLVDSEGETPLMVAARKGYIESLDLLLSSKKTLLNSRDKKGQTALIHALNRGNFQAAAKLLKLGADPIVLVRTLFVVNVRVLIQESSRYIRSGNDKAYQARLLAVPLPLSMQQVRREDSNLLAVTMKEADNYYQAIKTAAEFDYEAVKAHMKPFRVELVAEMKKYNLAKKAEPLIKQVISGGREALIEFLNCNDDEFDEMDITEELLLEVAREKLEANGPQQTATAFQTAGGAGAASSVGAVASLDMSAVD